MSVELGWLRGGTWSTRGGPGPHFMRLGPSVRESMNDEILEVVDKRNPHMGEVYATIMESYGSGPVREWHEYMDFLWRRWMDGRTHTNMDAWDNYYRGIMRMWVMGRFDDGS